LKKETSQLAELLKEGYDVAFFPEGTTSDGGAVLRFKSALFETARAGGHAIYPVCLTYEALNGAPLEWQNRDALFYYGEMTFGKHFLGLMRQDSCGVKMWFLKPIEAREEDRHFLCETAFHRIRSSYNPILRPRTVELTLQ
jgi:1-acyl-sn-glycerol-3-phosphate acyltransferase